MCSQEDCITQQKQTCVGRLYPSPGDNQVIQCELRNFYVVYAPLISSYGSVTASMQPHNALPVCVRGFPIDRSSSV